MDELINQEVISDLEQASDYMNNNNPISGYNKVRDYITPETRLFLYEITKVIDEEAFFCSHNLTGNIIFFNTSCSSAELENLTEAIINIIDKYEMWDNIFENKESFNVEEFSLGVTELSFIETNKKVIETKKNVGEIL